jgi:hypothetical protein
MTVHNDPVRGGYVVTAQYGPHQWEGDNSDSFCNGGVKPELHALTSFVAGFHLTSDQIASCRGRKQHL